MRSTILLAFIAVVAVFIGGGCRNQDAAGLRDDVRALHAQVLRLEGSWSVYRAHTAPRPDLTPEEAAKVPALARAVDDAFAALEEAFVAADALGAEAAR